MRGTLIALAVLAALVSGACDSASDDDDGRLTVVTTVSPITNIVANIAGPLADISGIVPEGTNSHTFEPAPSDARVLSRADVVYVNGLDLEVPTVELARANLADDAEIVALGERTLDRDEYIFDFSFPKRAGKPNPHVWTSPPLARRYAEIVKNDLSKRDPANAPTYRRNYAAFAARLDELDAALRSASATIRPERRKLLTYHDSFAYFAKAYGWTVVGAIQPSDFSEPTPREVGRLIDQVRDEQVPAIFGSEVFPSPVLDQIGKEARVRYVDTLRDDDLPGAPGDAEHTFLELLRVDYVTIVEALGGDASALRALDTSNVTNDKADYPQ